ncbi:MAG: hypothetical protein ABSG63_11330 [Spirochaetia bacterium]
MGHPFETRLPATFAAAHVAVINTIMKAGGEKVKWSRPSPCSADGCQYAFLFGNQLFFLFADIPEKPFDEGWQSQPRSPTWRKAYRTSRESGSLHQFVAPPATRISRDLRR